MLLFVCSPSLSFSLQAAVFPHVLTGSGREEIGVMAMMATARLAQHIPPWQGHNGTCEGQGFCSATLPPQNSSSLGRTEQAVVPGLGYYCRHQKPGRKTGFPGATPVGINTHTGQAALPREKITARWRHCLSARSYQSRKGTKEIAGVNGPNLRLPQP